MKTNRLLLILSFVIIFLALNSLSVAQESADETLASTEIATTEPTIIDLTETPTLEPTATLSETSTEIPFSTETPTAIPTEIPTQQATSEVTLEITQVATVESTPEGSATATIDSSMPTSSPTATATSESFIPELPLSMTPSVLFPEQKMEMFFSDVFNGGDDLAGWQLEEGWSFVEFENGQALKMPSDRKASFLSQPLYNLSVQANLAFNAGLVSLSIRQSNLGSYTVVLGLDGQLALYRAGTLLAFNSVTPSISGQRRVLAIAAIENVLRVSIDDVEVITAMDTSPLPAGNIAFMGSGNGTDGLLIDNVQVNVVSAELSALYGNVITSQVEPTLIPISDSLSSPQAFRNYNRAAAIDWADRNNNKDASFRGDCCGRYCATYIGITLYAGGIDTVSTTWTGNNQIIRWMLNNPDQWEFKSGISDLDRGDVVFYSDNPNAPANWSYIDPVGGWSLWLHSALVTNTGRVASWNGEYWNIPFDSFIGMSYRIFVHIKDTPPIPLAPSDLTATPVSQTQIDLSWRDNSNNENGFIIERWSNSVGNFVQIATVPANQTTYHHAGLTCGTFGHYRVKAFNAAGSSAYSNEAKATSFSCSRPSQRPVLISPANGAATNDNTPTFTWSPVNTPNVFYELQIDTDPNFASPILHVIRDIPFPTYTLTTPIADGRYYWRVRAYNNSGNGPWSTSTPTRNFKVDTVPPNPPTLMSPAINPIISNSRPRFCWNSVTDVNRYQIEIDNDPNFTSPLSLPENGGTVSTCFTASTLGQGQYWWHVHARDQADNWGSYGQIRSFTLTILTAPSDRRVFITATTSRPTFQWAAVPGASGYRLEISTNGSFTNPIRIKDFGSGRVSYQLSTVEALGHGFYYWRVYAINFPYVSSILPPLYRTFSVTPSVPPAPRLANPPNGATITDTTPDLSWNSVNYSYTAVTYELQVDNNSDFSTPIGWYDGISGTIRRVTTPLAGGGKRYYWRVRAVNGVGAPGNWSSARNFRVN